jgi:secreted protein with Ig-like and vWFA domain
LENGFSVLDIVKHASKMLVETLRSQDRLSILLYDDKVDVLIELIPMNDKNKKNAIQLIDKVTDRGSTDIFSAVKKGLEIIDQR